MQKKEGGLDCRVFNDKFSSVTLNKLSMKAREFVFQQDSQSKDWVNQVGKILNIITKLLHY